ncbi:MAG: divalent metal cation transporter [Armatimonadetes bacterium]|nr:divalent metal cation transporter [Armatimonadota bacterium]
MKPVTPKRWWQKLGPGIITGSADDDPSGIGTYSVAGAQFGYGMLWLCLICLPLMTVVQEMCGRIGVVTGKGLAGVLKEHYPRWLLYVALTLLFGANVINIYADLNVMADSMHMLVGGSETAWLCGQTVVMILLMILVPYKMYARVLKYLCLSLLAYVVTALLPSVHNDWGEIAHHLFIPTWQKGTPFILTVVGFLGTTISPYLFFWQASEEVEEEVEAGTVRVPGSRLTAATPQEISALRFDTAGGMLYSQIITFFIVICTAATLHQMGTTDIETAQDAAKALLPLGNIAYLLFTLGIIGTGWLAIPTLAGSFAYGLAETNGWKYGLFRRYGEAKQFYLTIAIMILLGLLLNFVHTINPVKGLLYSAALNGMVAPFLVALIVLATKNKKIVGENASPWWATTLGWATVVIMGGTTLILLWALFSGAAS